MTISSLSIACAATFVVLVGCSSDPAGADGSSIKPAGCARTSCDVAHDECMEKVAARERCGSCKDGCLGISDPDYAISCLESCPCSTSTSYVLESECDHHRQTCRSTDDERHCVDKK